MNNWITINNCVLGNSSQFGYQSSITTNITNSLSTFLQDPKIVVVLYNKNTGECYTKTGYDLGNKSDFDVNNSFTAYVAYSRINGTGTNTNTNTNTNTGTGTNTNTNTGTGKVTWDGTQFNLNGSKFYPAGFNAYWMGLMEDYSYPKNTEIEQMFIIAQKMAATVIRSHTLGFSSGSSQSLRPNSNTLNNSAWAPIDYAFKCANQYNIKLIVSLTDNYQYYHGGYTDYCNTRNVDKSVFFTDPNVRSDFKQYISDYLNHTNSLTGIQIKNDPSVLMIELGNELGNWSNIIPTQDWLSDISSYIKSITNIMVLDGTDVDLGQCGNFQVNTLDAYTGHFYDQNFSRMDNTITQTSALKKPYILGEYASNFDINFFKQVEQRTGINGSVFWSLYSNKDGVMDNGTPIIHNDGYTLNWTSNNMTQLLVLSNHFRRLQGLPETSQFS
jgi:mannan endo-1,4-beta-mannosidase